LEQRRFRLNEQEAMTVIYSLKDWLDRDDQVSDIYGAEDTAYQPLGYACKNGPMETLEEMLFVNGVTRELFYGGENREGLRTCLSVYGGGSVNINTAPVPVLLALSPRMNEGIARELDVYRREPTNRSDLQSKDWYQRIWPYDELIPEGLLTTRSSYFTLRMLGTLRDSRKHVRAVIHRTSESAGVVYWQETVQ
jgi:general secretion pathway protein K